MRIGLRTFSGSSFFPKILNCAATSAAVRPVLWFCRARRAAGAEARAGGGAR